MTTIDISDASASTDSAAMRQAMVSSQLRTTGVDDVRVVAAMGTVAREDFVAATSRAIAYRDGPLPLGGGRFQNPPMATGRLLTEAEILDGDRVLLIGAATGYTATVAALLGAQVTAVESDPALAEAARAALAGTDGVTLVEDSLAGGHADGAPYDVLLVDGAVEALPDSLVAQLRPGGRIATGLVERGVTRLASGRRTASGHGVMPFADAECVLLPGFARPTGFRF
ncbi:protein-L-isoaspartate O-methyltransferase [Sphingomonas sp. KR1UV-12]|uniref:Protein-L-isoaspartate O-methyltransferase n=1 Tax=Sphingomonas aurea TaxID=3063994 RepID=A0ABT9EHQ4_9SPHN|nr:protein-L-isoaspartate O-methyltransferase [Sphingomonas sp. KR1UV-12]MDP1026502.1 protein-L-isoaspartate O-methyltransferase [Sphingomonas sp. KR1UV-12]